MFCIVFVFRNLVFEESRNQQVAIGFQTAYCLARTREYQQKKMAGYLFHKIGVTAPHKRLRSLWDS